MGYHTFNPYTCREEMNFDFISDMELELKLKLSDRIFDDWRGWSFEDRGKILNNLANLLEENRHHHAVTITREMGKPISQSTAEVEKCAWVCKYYAEKAGGFLAPVKMKSTARESYIRFDPLGTIFAVMPWNFPYWQVFRFLAPNLMAGNCGLLKHASNVPQCASSIDQLVRDAGAPEGVFQNLFVNYEQAKTVIGHAGVSGVTLTGSNYAGNRIAALAGEQGKKTVLELGGSDPYIVLADADLEKSAEVAIMARFQNMGQSCISAKRFIIHEDVFDRFLDHFTARVEKLKIGDPMDPETVIGPLARKDLLLELENQIKHILDQGGRILTGGTRHEKEELILNPTIITDLPPDALINQEELFGPVIPVFRFSSDEEAVRMANLTPFGLGASIWSKDRQRAEMLAGQIEAGTVAINGMVMSDPNLPFGGIKASGYGRELSEAGIREFTNMKTVSIFS